MQTNTLLSVGVHRRASAAERLCSAFEAGAQSLDRSLDASFSPFLEGAGLRFNLRPLVLFLVGVLRTLRGRLLEREGELQHALDRVREAIDLRDRVMEPVRDQLKFFRAVGLPILASAVPRGNISRTPWKLLLQARDTCRNLRDCPLEDPPDLPAGVTLSPALRTELEQAVGQLEAALDDLAHRRRQVWTARIVRDTARTELDLHLELARGVHRLLQSLSDLNQKGGRHGEPSSQ